MKQSSTKSKNKNFQGKDVKILKVKWSPNSNPKAKQVPCPQVEQSAQSEVVQAVNPAVEQVGANAVVQLATPSVEATAPISTDTSTVEQPDSTTGNPIVNPTAEQSANNNIEIAPQTNKATPQADVNHKFDQQGANKSKQTANSASAKKSNAKGVGARRFFTAVGVVVCAVLILLFACNLTLIVKSFITPDQIPGMFGIVPAYVLTDSMSPEINGGDLVFIREADAKDVSKDDVIAFWDPSEEQPIVVVHRVREVFIDDDFNISFFTKGDNNDGNDLIAVPADNLVGIYVGRLPYLGRAAMFMRTTAGLVVCISVPLLMLLGYELVRYLRKGKELN